MSELEELYEKVTKAKEVCYGTTEKENPCKGCPYEAMECDSASEDDMYKLIELQHAEIERLFEEHKEQKK